MTTSKLAKITCDICGAEVDIMNTEDGMATIRWNAVITKSDGHSNQSGSAAIEYDSCTKCFESKIRTLMSDPNRPYDIWEF